MKAIIEALFEDGVLKPLGRLDLPRGSRVRITIEPVRPAAPDEVLALAASVYKGLSPADVAEIEEMARHRPLFTNSRP